MFDEKNYFEEWMNYQKKMFEPFMKFYEPKRNVENLFEGFNYMDPLQKLKDTDGLYKNLFTFFNDFNKNFLKSEDAFDFSKFSDYIKNYQEQYIKNIKNIFGIPSFTTGEDFLNYFFKVFGLSPFENSFFKPLKDYLKNVDITNLIFSNEELNKFLKSPALGLTREFVETVKKVIQNYIEYLKQLKIFDQQLTEKGKESFEKFLKNIFELSKKGENLDDFDKIFKKWIETNEEIFQEYLKSDEFGKFLSEFTKVSAQLKKSLDEYTFQTLKDTNIATKTELDRAYKEIYNLKKELRELKKTLNKKEKKNV
jgi:class III poly(R)-hydroxyalkanoic acid synthase PhaE subunit